MPEKNIYILSIKKQPNKELWLTGIIGILATSISVFSLLKPEVVYKTDEINQAYYPSDIGILLFGMPFLMETVER